MSNWGAMGEVNLLEETLEDIELSGHEVEDISFIGSEKTGHQCTWEEFKVLADHVYIDSYGATKVARDLVIVFSDGQKMWRGNFDGREWWEYSVPFKVPAVQKFIKNLFRNENQSESDLHEIIENE